MIAGRFTFTGLSEYLTWQKIKQLDYSFPEGFDPEAKDLVQKLIVRDPAGRLGAGPPDSPTSMEALRSHPFFASIDWKTLWTEPAPPLEPGLVVREHPLAGQDKNWDDVGASWDDIAEGEDGEADGDGIRWADDADVPAYIMKGGYGASKISSYSHDDDETGPISELSSYRLQTDATRLAAEQVVEEDMETVMGHDSPISATGTTAVDEPEPIDVPGVPSTVETGSSTSSSDGSPVEKLGVALEAMKVDRGRDRGPTPVQGNGPSPEVDWYVSWLTAFSPYKYRI